MAVIVGTEANDVLTGTSDNDELSGLAGDDVLDGGTGNDQLDGGDGNDTLVDSDGGVIVIDGGTGDDRIVLGAGAASGGTITGGAGVDRLETGGQGIHLLNISGVEELAVADAGTTATAAQLSAFQFILAANPLATSITLTLAAPGVADLTTQLGPRSVTFFGSSGDDGLTSSAGADILNGMDGNDVLASGGGADNLDGGDGDDQLDGGADNDTVLGMAGADFAHGGTGDDAMKGGAGNDTFYGDDGADTIEGEADNDTLAGGLGIDLLDGGAGDDILDGGAGNDELLGMAGADSAFGGLGDDRILGGAGNDFISGDDGADDLRGEADSDSLAGGLGVDRLDGGDGDDFLDGGADNDELFGMAGADLARGGAGADRILGGAGADTIYGDDGADDLQGEADDDTLAGGLGIDRLDGGDGADFLDGGVDDDELFGMAGADTAYGGLGNDRILGGLDGDAMYGDAGVDHIEGEAGGDLLSGGAGADTLLGGDGDDNIYFDEADLAAGQVRGGAGIDWILNSTEGPLAALLQINLVTLEAEAYYGSAGAEQVDASASLVGVSLVGNGGDDHLSSGLGNDILDGGAGADTLLANAGDDYIHFDAADLATGQVRGGSGYDWVFNQTSGPPPALLAVSMATLEAEGYYGGGGNEQVNATGVATSVTIYGNGGSDQLTGGSGDDYIYFDAADLSGGSIAGGLGYDWAYLNEHVAVSLNLAATGFEGGYGRNGNDTFNASGKTTSVTLLGNGGADTLAGGSGDDYIYFDAADLSGGSIAGGSGYDWAYLNEHVGVSLNLAAGGFEAAYGRDGNDVFNATGVATSVTLLGNGGADTLTGGSGDDYIYFDAADLASGAIAGGSGYDYAIFNELGVGTSLNLTTTGFEAAIGRNGNDVFTAAGSAAGVSLYGYEGNDSLTGGTQTDYLYGDTGNDILTGGGGADNFITYTGWGQDTLTDFQQGVDRVRMSVAGLTAFSQLAISQDGADALVSYNGNSLRFLNTSAASIDVSDFLNLANALSAEDPQMLIADKDSQPAALVLPDFGRETDAGLTLQPEFAHEELVVELAASAYERAATYGFDREAFLAGDAERTLIYAWEWDAWTFAG